MTTVVPAMRAHCLSDDIRDAYILGIFKKNNGQKRSHSREFGIKTHTV